MLLEFQRGRILLQDAVKENSTQRKIPPFLGRKAEGRQSCLPNACQGIYKTHLQRFKPRLYVSLALFCFCCDKHYDQKQLKKERVYFTLQFTINCEGTSVQELGSPWKDSWGNEKGSKGRMILFQFTWYQNPPGQANTPWEFPCTEGKTCQPWTVCPVKLPFRYGGEKDVHNRTRGERMYSHHECYREFSDWC